MPPRASRFLALPSELRNQIYRLCLTYQKPIPIKCKSPDNVMRDTAYGWVDERVRLTTSRFLVRREEYKICANLLRVNRRTHEEAASILYGLNTFSFYYEYDWVHLFYFEIHLTSTSHRNIRNIIIKFPHMARRIDDEGKITSCFTSESEIGIKALEQFSSLTTLTFRVFDDIMTHEIGLLQQLHGACGLRCRVVMEVWKSKRYNEYFEITGPDPARISSSAFEMMREWGWEMKGYYEEVDQNHKFRDESEWVKWTRRNEWDQYRSSLVV